jgi:mRNA interferase MazF
MSRGKRGGEYFPDRGDFIHLDLHPSAGHELSGPHFALVLTTERFAKATGFCIILPATSKYHPDQKLVNTQLMAPLPEMDDLPEKRGWVYTHQVKAVDFRERSAKLVTQIDDLDFLIEMMDRVRAFIDPDSIV